MVVGGAGGGVRPWRPTVLTCPRSCGPLGIYATPCVCCTGASRSAGVAGSEGAAGTVGARGKSQRLHKLPPLRSFPIARAKAASAATLCEGMATGFIPTARLDGGSAMEGASAVDGGKS
jgi:hypothetical protein